MQHPARKSIKGLFITDMIKAAEQRGAGYIHSAHKSLESFKFIYMPPTQGCIRTDQRIESVGLFLASFAGTVGIGGTVHEKGKPLEKQKIAVS